MMESDSVSHQIIARIRSPYVEKFGVPRQSGLAPSVRGELIFEPAFRQHEALRELEGFSHLWLIFGFHKVERKGWKATVRPPRLGGNQRVGVFATRSPFRPNPIGLSVVSLLEVEDCSVDGPRLLLGGLDLVDQTPVFDIKPYIPYADSIPQAQGGFAAAAPTHRLKVEVADSCYSAWSRLSDDRKAVIQESLCLDPRPAFQEADRIYRLSIAGCEIGCQISEDTCTIIELVNRE